MYYFCFLQIKDCANYCALDVKATQEVFETIWPMFLEHVPHPASFAGMLEMGTSYLPITRSWQKYIERSEKMYLKVTNEMKDSLMAVAEGVLTQLIDKRWKNLFDL